MGRQWLSGSGEVRRQGHRAVASAPGGDWSEPVTLAVVGQHYWLSDLVVDAAGRATYSVYFVGRVVRYSGFVQTWHPNGQLVSKLHTVSKDGCTFSSDCGTDLVGDAQGDVMAVWVKLPVAESAIGRPEAVGPRQHTRGARLSDTGCMADHSCP